ncbi:MAG: UDP-2,3-diacylglucosamine diphosphatase LpxI [Bauldia sp.]|nr:UDP-2,3-diacylglucosamine diphosphatase LpxI [Bauldia sp.]
MDGSIAPVLAEARPLAILAGGGSVPLIVAAAAQRAGRPFIVVGIRGEADREIEAYRHRWVGWGEVGRLLLALKATRTEDLVLVGRIGSRPDYHGAPLDRGGVLARPAILRIFSGGDNSVLLGAVRLFESRGFNILGAHEIARELVVPAGWLGRVEASPRDLRDGEAAFAAAKMIGRLDIGQAAVAVGGRVVALEGAEGTDGMLERVAALRATGRVTSHGPAGALGKCAKPHQDLRVDMPTIGPETIRAAAAAGLAGVVVEAGRVMIAEREATIRVANSLGLFLVAREDGDGARA